MEIKDGGILIVSGPRTGSTNLGKSISSFYKKKFIFEPYIFDDTQLFDEKSDVVKIIPPDGDYNKIISVIKKFNTIILLDRKNKKEQCDSLYSLNKNKTFDTKWFIDDIDRDCIEYKNYLIEVKKISDILESISKDLNLEIDYYEELYSDKKLKNKKILLDSSFFDKKYKLRSTRTIV